MKSVLVLSDNSRLVSYLKKEIDFQGLHDLATFSYCYSSINESTNQLDKIGMAPINLKSLSTCNSVIERYDIILSLHCKQVFPKKLTENIVCINFHPGFNPFNRGWYPQVFSIINNKPIGATVHLMDEWVDHGKIIDQAMVEIYPDDTSLTLYERVIYLEERLISENIKNILTGTYEISCPEGEGNYNSIKDFRNLCELDLNATGTLKEHINILRALTHGNFKNAHYYENGKKIYISVNLSKDKDVN